MKSFENKILDQYRAVLLREPRTRTFYKKIFSIHLSVFVGTGRDLSCLHHHSLFILFKNQHFKPFENKIFDQKQASSVSCTTNQGLVNFGIFFGIPVCNWSLWRWQDKSRLVLPTQHPKVPLLIYAREDDYKPLTGNKISIKKD